MTDNKSFSFVEDKLAEAEFFLDHMKTVGTNIFALRCYFSAFVSATRSVSFVLQSVMKHVPGFDEWYSYKQSELKDNYLARFFLQRRNETLKIGDTRINAGMGYKDEDGRVIVRYHFLKVGPTDPFEPIENDVLTASQEYLRVIKEIVEDCTKEFAAEVDPDVFFTTENLQSKGISIEDVEEMLGFPCGWTKGIPDVERLRLLKDSPSPIMAKWIAEEYLTGTRQDDNS